MNSTHKYTCEYLSKEGRDIARLRILSMLDKLIIDSDYKDSFTYEEYQEDNKYILKIVYYIS